jgi:hypothetical protein
MSKAASPVARWAMAVQARVSVEAYTSYSADSAFQAAGANSRRTQLIEKRAIYGWTIVDDNQPLGSDANCEAMGSITQYRSSMFMEITSRQFQEIKVED